MRIPKQFQLAGVVWKVIQQDTLNDNNGLCDRDNATIFLAKNLKSPQKELTFLHELIHAIRYSRGEVDGHDEKDVDSFARLLHQYMLTAK